MLSASEVGSLFSHCCPVSHSRVFLDSLEARVYRAGLVPAPSFSTFDKNKSFVNDLSFGRRVFVGWLIDWLDLKAGVVQLAMWG